MKTSEINFIIDLDKDNVPEKIHWGATDTGKDGKTETEAISIALWDQKQKNTMRIDLWTKDMPIDEMKRFHVDCIGGFAQTILSATGDEYMANEMNALCEKLVDHIKKEYDQGD
jgi:gliding motility-associated protein GldC